MMPSSEPWPGRAVESLWADGAMVRSEPRQRELRRTLTTPTEEEQVKAFEELRQRVDAQTGRGHQGVRRE
jgi:hypothetical protein